MNERSTEIDKFLRFMREAKTECNACETQLKESDDATQDILHSLELEQHNYHEFARLSKELARVRQQRRSAKDTLQTTKVISDWADTNQQAIKSLERMLGQVRNLEKKNANKSYTPRYYDREVIVSDSNT